VKKEILVSIDELETRVAILEDGRLMEIYIAREDRQVGSIYKGKVVNVLPGMQAAFVDIGLERNVFLCADDAMSSFGQDVDPDDLKKLSIKDYLKVNQETLVQITKESIGSKGARVTTYITLPGRYLVILPRAKFIGISRRIEDEEERGRLKKAVDSIKPKNFGIIVRTAAEGKSNDELKRDLEFQIKLWDKIQAAARKKKPPVLIHQELALVYKIIRDLFTEEVNRFIIDSPSEYEKVLELLDLISPSLKNRVHLYEDRVPLFEAHNIEPEIDKALRPKVWLESGGYLVIDKTEALTVIDVNTGKYIGKTSLADTILKTNLEAVEEITRQLRLRDMGGIIIIDFIDMEKEGDKNRVLQALSTALKKDRTKTNIVSMTELGLVQLTRKRVNRDLDQYLREDCPYCAGKGRISSVTTTRIKTEREIRRVSREAKYDSILLTVNPRLALPLLGWEGEDLDRLEKQAGKYIYLRVNRDLHQEKIELVNQSQKKIEECIEMLWPGQELDLSVDEAFEFNIQNGLAIYRGNIIEVIGAGNMVGSTLKVVLTRVSHSYAQGQIKE
jgi:ribonuclease G